MSPAPLGIQDQITKAVEQAITDSIAEAKERLVKVAVAQFEKEVRTAVGSVAINVGNYYSVLRDGPNLLITIEMEGTQNEKAPTA